MRIVGPVRSLFPLVLILESVIQPISFPAFAARSNPADYPAFAFETQAFSPVELIGTTHPYTERPSSEVRVQAAAEGGMNRKELYTFSDVRERGPRGGKMDLFLTRHIEFSLNLNGHGIFGNYLELDGLGYLQIGDRWVTVPHGAQWPNFDIRGLARSELQLGNPSLCFNLLGLSSPNLQDAFRPLPEGYSIVNEIPDLMMNSYADPMIRFAEGELRGQTPIKFDLQTTKGQQQLAQFLNAFLITAHPTARAEKAYSEARQDLEIFLAAHNDDTKGDAPNGDHRQELIAFVRRQMNFALQRKFQTATMLLSYLARIKNAEAQQAQSGDAKAKPTVTGHGVILGADGQLRDVDFAGDANLPRNVAADEGWSIGRADFDELRQGYLGLEAFLFIAGEASRVYQPMFGVNKLLHEVCAVQEGHEADVLRQLRQAGVKADLYRPQGSRYSYVAATHVIAALNRGAEYILGVSTLKPFLEALPREKPPLVQPMSPVLTAEGKMDSSVVGIGGHGEVSQKVASERELLIRWLNHGVAPRFVQGDDVGDDEISLIMAYYLQTGKAGMVGTVTPQKIEFSNASPDDVHRYRRVLTAIQSIVQESLRAGTDQEQRDMWISALQQFADMIETPAATAGHKIDVYKGGILLRYGATTTFVEGSQLPSKVTLIDSHGDKHTFSSLAFMALIGIYFNTNNFAPDPLVYAANRDRRIKALYQQYIRDAALARTPAAFVGLRREVEKQAALVMQKLSNAEWNARSWIIDRLRIGLMGIPLEWKMERWKLNQMNQQVTSFEVNLALTDFTAEDIADLADLDRLAAPGLTIADKNAIITEAGWKVARRDDLQALSEFLDIQLLLVHPDKFTQIKVVWDFLRFAEMVAVRFPGLVRRTLGALYGIAGVRWVERMAQAGDISPAALVSLRTLFLAAANGADLSDEVLDLLYKAGAIMGYRASTSIPSRISHSDDPWNAIREADDPRDLKKDPHVNYSPGAEGPRPELIFIERHLTVAA